MSPEFVSPQGSYGAEADVNNFSDVTPNIVSGERSRICECGSKVPDQRRLLIHKGSLDVTRIAEDISNRHMYLAMKRFFECNSNFINDNNLIFIKLVLEYLGAPLSVQFSFLRDLNALVVKP